MNITNFDQTNRNLTNLAIDFTRSCPPKLCSEIWLVGSVSRGQADSSSDIEIQFYSPNKPNPHQITSWISQTGIQLVNHQFHKEPDESITLQGQYQKIWIEANWQHITLLNKQINHILALKETQHNLIKLAWMITKAKPLTTEGLLKDYQQKLSTYPQGLTQRLINSSIETWDYWNYAHRLESRWALATRGDYFPLLERLTIDLTQTLRILFAINEQWEPNWKWIPWIIKDLKIKPQNLLSDLNTILQLESPLLSVYVDLNLSLNILKLIENDYPVKDQVKRIKESLSKWEKHPDINKVLPS